MKREYALYYLALIICSVNVPMYGAEQKQQWYKIKKFECKDFANAAHFDSQGKMIVAASKDMSVRVWNATTGQELLKVFHNQAVNSALFNSNGTKIVSASDDWTAKVWQVPTGVEQFCLKHNGAVSTAAFSSDNMNIVTASNDGTVRLWNANAGQEKRRIQYHNTYAVAAYFNPQNTHIAVLPLAVWAQVWDAQLEHKDGELWEHPDGGYESLNTICWNPEGTVVVAGGDTSIFGWGVATKKQIMRFTAGATLLSVSWNKIKNQIVAASQLDNTATISDVATQKEVAVLEGEDKDEFTFCADWNEKGTKIVTASGNFVYLWKQKK